MNATVFKLVGKRAVSAPESREYTVLFRQDEGSFTFKLFGVETISAEDRIAVAKHFEAAARRLRKGAKGI